VRATTIGPPLGFGVDLERSEKLEPAARVADDDDEWPVVVWSRHAVRFPWCRLQWATIARLRRGRKCPSARNRAAQTLPTIAGGKA
jgi:hypothetical protein